MAVGIIIHVSVGAEKRTEFFTDRNIRIGAGAGSDLQIHSPEVAAAGAWLDLESDGGVYRIINFDESLKLTHNGAPVCRYVAVFDGDRVEMPQAGIAFSFFTLESKSALITTNRELPHVAPFIEDAAIGARVSPRRDDAKSFLREFVRELAREIHWTTKLAILAVVVGALWAALYLGLAFNRELEKNRETAERNSRLVEELQSRISQTSDQIGEIDKSNKDIIKTVSLAPNLRGEYGGGVGLIVGVYDLVDKKTGKVLRYPDPQNYQANPFEVEPTPSTENGGSGAAATPAGSAPATTTAAATTASTSAPTSTNAAALPPSGLTTEGAGSPVEYDFIGTGFHAGGGYIVTNRHVVQPWEEDDLVKQMMRDAGARARVKRLVIYFPNAPQPFNLKVRQVGTSEDLAVGSIDLTAGAPDIPALPLDAESEAVSVGKTVVTMGYPNGPDRLLAMVDDAEAKSINEKFGGSRQSLINFLAQSRKIVPLTTQGAITDLDARRIVHDAKTAEGGSGAPLFGQTGKVIGVNFGVFTENTAANMAIPVRFAIELLKRAGWKSPEQLKTEAAAQNQTASAANSPNAAAKAQ